MITRSPLRIGARASVMSLAQTARILAELTMPSVLIPFDSHGDHEGAARAALEADGAFTAEIEQALLADEIDIAVHCLKDAPHS
ncbi:hypothetical protein ACFWMU_08135 [Streptomyces sp. NPDC058357]|uniref:hypothetical protein n=1 Tax=unclassified Streptomyces TaxID=2593676 RepID=UPI003653B4FA